MAEVLGVVASVIGVLDAAGKLWSFSWQYYQDAKNAATDIKRLMDNITTLQSLFQRIEGLAKNPDTSKLINIPSTKELIQSISAELEEVFKGLIRILDPAQAGIEKKRRFRLWGSTQKLKWPLQKQEVEKTLQLLEQHKTALILAINSDQMTAVIKMSTQIESQKQAANIAKLPCAEAAVHSHRLWQHEDHCLQGTRVELRKQIMEWYDDPNGGCIFWLNGMAGTGKSTISRTLASQLADKKRLAASFYFSRGRGDISHAGKFFTTIASQLANNLPVLRASISKAIDENFDIFQQGLREQWKHLILNPLKNAPAQAIQLVVIIDALDECDSKEDIQLILQLLAEAKDLDTIRLRIFTTSRPEAPIVLGFGSLPGEAYHDCVLHDIPMSTVNQDITIFFQQKLAQVKAEHGLGTPWPDEQIIQKLVEKAAGLFIYAATTYRFIKEDDDPEEQLSLVLRESTTPNLGNLDEMYTTLLQHSVKGNKGREEFLSKIVGSIVTMFNVIPARDLAKLLEISLKRVQGTLASLRSVLNVPEDESQPVKIFHLSFRDFLLDPKRCSDPRFLIDEKKMQLNLFHKCMLLISKLPQNICNLPELGLQVQKISEDTIRQNIPPHVRYACRYWFDHFQGCSTKALHNPGQENDEVKETINTIRDFLERHLLRWLEVLSLIDEVSNGVLIIKSLEEILKGKLKNYANSDLLELVHDAKRFILHNRFIIGRAPLQVYYSGLLFAPKSSLVRKNYLTGPSSVLVNRELEVPDIWSPLLQTLEGHTKEAHSVVFSPNGQHIASGSFDATIRLWEITTGKQCGIFEGHTGPIKSIAYSPDGRLIVSGSNDCTIRLWDIVTGQQCGILEGHTHTIRSVCFSPDGSMIASGSHDDTIRVWDTLTRKPREVFDGDKINSVVFSPDGKLLASGTSNDTLLLSDLATGKQHKIVLSNAKTIFSIAFSPNGRLIAIGSDDKAIRICDIGTKKQSRIFEGHTKLVRSVAFSSDGRFLASGSADQTIRLWDTMTGEQCDIFKGHVHSVLSVVFSGDGRFLASGGEDRTVRIWDRMAGKQQEPLEGHSQGINCVDFSPDGKLVASASPDGTIRLWDTLTGQPCGVFEGHTKSVNVVRFSYDGRMLASGSDDTTVRVWDMVSGKQYRVLTGHTDDIWCLAFSPDSKVLASAAGSLHKDRGVRLWDIATETQIGILLGHEGPVHAAVFSPDGKMISTGGTFDRTVRLWEVSGQQCAVLEGHTSWIKSVIFSSDGKLVASACLDNIIRLWDIAQKKTIEIMEIPKSILFVNISDSGTRILTDGGGSLSKRNTSGSNPLLAETTYFLHFHQSRKWVSCNGKKLFWLPPEYRPQAGALKDNLLAIGCSSGRVVLISIDPTALLPVYLQSSSNPTDSGSDYSITEL